MRFKYLAIAVALAATAASAAPVIESTETLTAKLDEGHLNHEAMEKRYYTPRLSVRKRSPDATLEVHPKSAEAMEKRWSNPRPVKVMKKRFIRLKRAEASENSHGNLYDNPSDREGHPDAQISRGAWHGPGSAACIDKSRGCYSEE